MSNSIGPHENTLGSKVIIETKVPRETFSLEWKMRNLSVICPFLGHQDSLPLQTLRTEKFQMGQQLERPSMWYVAIDFDYTTTAGNKYVMIALVLDKELPHQPPPNFNPSMSRGEFLAKIVAQLVADDGEVLMHHKSTVQKFNVGTPTGSGNGSNSELTNKWQTFIPDHAFRSENMQEQVLVKDSMTLRLTIHLFGPHMIRSEQVLIPATDHDHAHFGFSSFTSGPMPMLGSGSGSGEAAAAPPTLLRSSTHNSSWLRRLWTEKIYSDLEVRTETTTFNVHKTVVCGASPVFEAMLKHDMEEKMSNVIHLQDDFEPDTVENMFKFLYCSLDLDLDLQVEKRSDKIHQDDGNESGKWTKLVDLIYAADKYQIENLKEFAFAQISKLVSEENVGHLIVLNDRMVTPRYFHKVLINFCTGRRLSLSQNKCFLKCIEQFPMAFVGFLFNGLNWGLEVGPMRETSL